MSDELHVNPDELRAASSSWHMEAFDLHAIPPSLDPSGGWPTMVASTGVTGAAHTCTVDLHARIAATAGMTQVAATGYEAADCDSAEMLKNVVSTITGAGRRDA